MRKRVSEEYVNGKGPCDKKRSENNVLYKLSVRNKRKISFVNIKPNCVIRLNMCV